MRPRQTFLSPPLRLLAVLSLAVFLVAQGMCFVHCHFGGGHESESQPSCHASSQDAPSHDDDAAPGTSWPTAACAALKGMLAGGDAPVVAVFPGPALSLPFSFSATLDAVPTEPAAVLRRQLHCRERVFTPEVCLGPAFRSLAPPFVG